MQSAREKYRIEHASRKTLQVLVEGQQHFGEIMQARNTWELTILNRMKQAHSHTVNLGDTLHPSDMKTKWNFRLCIYWYKHKIYHMFKLN